MSSVVVVGTQWGDEGKGKSRISSVKMRKLSRAIKVVIMLGIPSLSRELNINYI